MIIVDVPKVIGISEELLMKETNSRKSYSYRIKDPLMEALSQAGRNLRDKLQVRS
jgi:hypothetical protein